MRSDGIRINKLAVRLRGVTPSEARGRGTSIAHAVALAVSRQAARTTGGARRVDRLTLSRPSAFEREIERQWTEK